MDLRQFYISVRARTEEICAPLRTEDHVPQPVPFVSPPKWHLAHSAWFFEQMILRHHHPQFEVYDPQFAFLFNSYYNHLGDRTARVDRGNMTRPTVDEILAYRHHVDEKMLDLLTDRLSHQPLIDLVILGLQHEQQHQELLLTDIQYILGLQPTLPPYDHSVALENDHNLETGWLDMPEGIYEIGHAGDGFCFDNERDRHKVYLQGYQIDRGLVTNGEYQAFIAAGGYSRFDLWLDEGWAWVKENAIQHPLYWHLVGEEWLAYTLAGLRRLDPDAILCHVNFYEASAYAAWRGLHLPTEAQWEAAAPQLQWGLRWEWTNSAYLPYPGFKIAPGAVGEYNGKFMINQMVLRGASTATPAGHSRPTYRNFFHPHLQWQFSGIRLAR